MSPAEPPPGGAPDEPDGWTLAARFGGDPDIDATLHPPSDDDWPPGPPPYDPPPDEPTPGAVPVGDRTEQLRAALLDSAGLDKIPPPRPIIGDLLDADTAAWLYGKPGSGKSLVALSMAAAVAGGHPEWFGHPVYPAGQVLYLALEGARGMGMRKRAWEHFHAELTAVRFLTEPVHLPADAGALGQLAAQMRAGLVVIDTQAAATIGLDENSPRDGGIIAGAVDRIRRASGACVLVVHHEPRNGDHPRGHSAIDGTAGSLLRVSRDGPIITLTCIKQRDGEAGAAVKLAIRAHADSVIVRTTGVGPNDLVPDSEAAVLAALRSNMVLQGGASRSGLEKDAGLPHGTFNRALSSLVKAGKVRNEGSSRRTWYVLANPSDLLPDGPG